MCKFKDFIKNIFRLEGGYVNHPNDKGGCTNKGITIETFRSFYGKDMTCSDLKSITDEQAETIYKNNYWNPCWGDKIYCHKIAELLVDWAINSGVKTAIKGIQRIVGVDVDGVMGPKTLKAINDYPVKPLFDKLKEERKLFYENIVKKNPSQEVFLKGWLNRLNSYKWCNE